MSTIKLVTPDFKPTKPSPMTSARVKDLEARISELEDELANETKRADEEHDRAELLSEKVEELEAKIEEYGDYDPHNDEVLHHDQREVLDLVTDLATAHSRYMTGVESELQTIVDLITKLQEVTL